MKNADLIGYAKEATLFSEIGSSRLLQLDRTLMIEVIAEKIMEGIEEGATFLRPIPDDVLVYIRKQGCLWESFK